MGKSITKDWTKPVINRASETVVTGPVGEIARTDGTDWQGQCVGPLTRTVILIWGSSVQG